MSRTVNLRGVRTAPELADLLTAAEAQGFRLEAASNGGHPVDTGFAVYPPDKALPPIRVGVARCSPKHLSNVRSALRAAGFTDGQTTEEPAMAKPRRQPAPTTIPDAFAVITDEDERTRFLATLVTTAVEEVIPHDVAVLAAVLVDTVVDWQRRGGRTLEDADHTACQTLLTDAEADRDAAREDVERLTRDLARLTEKYDAAALDAKTEREARVAAEERAHSLDAALRPLRAILATGGGQ